MSRPTCVAALVGRNSHPPDDASVFTARRGSGSGNPMSETTAIPSVGDVPGRPARRCPERDRCSTPVLTSFQVTTVSAATGREHVRAVQCARSASSDWWTSSTSPTVDHDGSMTLWR